MSKVTVWKMAIFQTDIFRLFFFFLSKWVFVTNRLLFFPGWFFSVTLCLTLPPLGLVIRAFDHNLVTLCVCNACACACSCFTFSHIQNLQDLFFFMSGRGDKRRRFKGGEKRMRERKAGEKLSCNIHWLQKILFYMNCFVHIFFY